MTVVAYNQDRQWDIPGYVWPAVLGVSLALHVSALIYGLPALPWREEAPVPPVETEVILESGGLPFEDLASVETEITQPLEPDTPLPVETSVPVETVVNSGTAEILEPVLSEPVLTESPVNTMVEAAPVTVLDQSLSDDTPIIEAQEVSPVETNPVTATPPDQLQVIQPSVVQQTASTVVAATPVPEAVVAVTPVAPNVVAGSEVTLSGAEVPAAVEVVPSVAVATDIGEVATTGETQTIVAAVQESPVLAPLAGDQTPAEPTGNEVVSEVFVPQTQPSVESPGIVAPDTSVTVDPVATAEVDAVLPAEQQVAALQPTEAETPELVPNARSLQRSPQRSLKGS